MQYLKYILWGVGAFFIVAGADSGNAGPIVLGIILVLAGSFTKIKSTVSDFSSSKAQEDLLKLKNLLDQGVLTQEEYNKKAQKLKDKI